METDTITVRLLGGFSLSFGASTLIPLPPQAVSLLSYLIVHRDRPQTRDLLAGRFWSELPEDRARKRLSNSLWQIKTAAAESGIPELLSTAPSTVQATTAHRFDVDAEMFEAQMADFEHELRTRQVRGVLTDRLAGLVDGYPGDFLSGYYHDWIEPERDRIRERYHAALVQLIGLYKSRSQYDVALRFAHTLVKQEPLREDLHQEVMRLHALLGQAPAAERQFEECRQVLDAELGVEPSAETVQLLERIRTDTPAPALSYTPTADVPSALIGRTQELAVLLGRVDELLSGSGGVVLVEGDPGIGKTRLIHEFLEAAEWRGVRILQAGHTGLSRLRPFETLKETLAPAVTGLRGEHLAEVVEPVWLQQAAEVVPDLARLVDGSGPSRPLRPDEEPTRMSEALARVILAQGGLGPTLIVLEDIHWCDDDSMQVLAQLGSRLARSGVLLCLTYRRFEAEQAESVWAGISKLEALPSGSRLVVGPLGPSEVRELVNVQLGPGGLPASAVTQLVAATNGNPLYVLESLRNPSALVAQLDGHGEDDLGPLTLPSTVAKSLEARVAALSPEVLAILEALAALAEPAAPGLVAEVAGVPRRRAVEALARMAERGFVEDDDRGICRFAHDQTRQMVYDLMGTGDQRSIHRRIYQALDERDDRQPAQLAYHARLADRMDEARRWHLVAARQALAVNGYRTAADHYGQADDAAQELGVALAERAKDLLAYEVTLDVLGRRSEQTMLLKRLREVDLPLPVALELAEREVWLLINTDEPEEAARLATRSVEQAQLSGQPVVGLLTAVAVARYRAGDFTGAAGPAREALTAAVDVPEQVAAETILGKALVDLMQLEEGERYLARAVANAELAGDDRAKIEALSYRGVAAFRLSHLEDAESFFTEALELSRSVGYRWGEAANLVNLASLHTARGHGGQAVEFFDGASEVFGSLDYGRGEAIVKHNSAELNHRLLGDDDAAAELASSAAVYYRSVGDQPNECLAMAVLSGVDRRNGKRRLARRRLNDLLDRVTAGDDPNGEVEIRRHLADIDIDGGDYRSAAAHLERILRLGERYPLDNVVPNVTANAALVAWRLGDRAKAEALLQRALAVNMAGVELAHLTAWNCATVLSELGREAEATEQFQLAYELLSSSLRGLPADVVDRSWSGIPEHGRIAEDYQRRFVVTAAAHVPRTDAPMGRSLRSDEFVDIVWTVSMPDDWAVESPAERRRGRLTRMADEAERQDGSARIADLADALGVSERTVKRDLADLRAAGVPVRTRKSV